MGHAHHATYSATVVDVLHGRLQLEALSASQGSATVVDVLRREA